MILVYQNTFFLILLPKKRLHCQKASCQSMTSEMNLHSGVNCDEQT